MSNMQAAAADIKKLGAYLSGLIAFADELESMGSIQQAANEADARIKACAVKESEAMKDLEAAQLALSDAKEKAADIVQAGENKAADSIAKAKSQVEAILADAKDQAESIIGPVQGKKIDLELQIQSLKEKKASAQVEAEQVQAVLESLKAELEALKAKLGA